MTDSPPTVPADGVLGGADRWPPPGHVNVTRDPVSDAVVLRHTGLDGSRHAVPFTAAGACFVAAELRRIANTVARGDPPYPRPLRPRPPRTES